MVASIQNDALATGAPSPGPVQAASVNSFINSVGVNAHLTWSNTTGYSSAQNVENAVAYLGVKNIRDGDPFSWALSEYVALAQTGVKFDLLQNGPTVDAAKDLQVDNTLEAAAPGSIESIEGENEYNVNKLTLNGESSTGNIAWGALDDQNLQSAVEADPSLAGVKIVAASTANASSGASVGQYVDASNWHVYAGVGQQLQNNMLSGIAAAKASAPGKPVYITETGISSSGYGSSTWGVTDPKTQGIIDLNAVLDGYKDGAAKTFLYELMDDEDSPADQESNFGLFNADGTPKAAANDLHDLFAILADSGTVTNPGTLDYSLAGLPSTATSTLLEKSNGAFDIVIWNDNAAVSNGTADTTPPTSNVTVTFGSAFQNINVYDPMQGTSAIQSLTDAATVSVGLSADPVIIEVLPNAPAATPPSQGTTSGSTGSSAPAPAPTGVPVHVVVPIHLVLPGASGTLTGSAGQNQFRFTVAGLTNTITNFHAGSSGDAVQLMGATSYATSNYDISDLVWNYGSLTPVTWELNGAAVKGAAALGGSFGSDVLPGYHVAAVGDFNGDGTSDLLLTANNASPFAPDVIWNIGNGTLVSGEVLPYGSASSKVWAGDFDGDGTTDILWDEGGAAPFLWEMKNNQVIAAGWIGGGPGMPVLPGYHIAGVGDFNGDGKSDILWAANVPNPNSPAVIWYMNGLAVAGASVLPYGATSTKAWIGDFNGDGISDILWDNGSATPVLWEMSGTGTVIGAAALGGAYGAQVLPGYHIAGVGDFNGDGDADILLAANTPNPDSPAVIWFMNGLTIASAQILPYGATPTTALIGNFNIDGTTIKSDNGQTVVLSGVNKASLVTGNVQTVSFTLDESSQTAGASVDLSAGTSSVSGQVLGGYTSVTGTQYDDTLRGHAQAGGTSVLTGNGGSDTYDFGRGDGAVTIVNGVAPANAAAGQVDFASGIADTGLWLAKVGNNLVIDVLGTRDQVTIQNWYGNAYSQVLKIVDGSGLKLDSAVNTLVNAMAGFSAAHPGFNPQATGAAMPGDATLNAAVLAAWHS